MKDKCPACVAEKFRTPPGEAMVIGLITARTSHGALCHKHSHFYEKRMRVERVMKCTHRRRHEKSYVGSLETYFYCPDCLETWGGEETPAKKALIASAARAQVTEQDEASSSGTKSE